MTDTRDAAIDRLEVVLARLERLGGVTISPLAAVDPDGFPSHVASGELIESAWGNAVVDNLHRIDTNVTDNTNAINNAKPYAITVARTSDDATPIGVFGTVASVDLGTATAGTWMITATAMVRAPANDIVIARLRAGGNDVGPWVANWDVLGTKGSTLTLAGHVALPAATSPYRFEMDAYGYGTQLLLMTGSRITVSYIGPP